MRAEELTLVAEQPALLSALFSRAGLPLDKEVEYWEPSVKQAKHNLLCRPQAWTVSMLD